MVDAVEPVTLAIPDTDIADLRVPLRAARWPDKETGFADFEQPKIFVREVRYCIR